MSSVAQNPMAGLYRRLGAVGFDKKFVQTVVLPDWWDDKIADTAAGFDEGVWFIARNLGLDPSSLRNPNAAIRVAWDGTQFTKGSSKMETKLLPLPAGVPADAIRIIDIYHGDAPVDFHALNDAGVAAVYLKATQGLTEVDPCFHDFYARAKSVGLLVGAYHFFAPGDDPIAQMEHFRSVARPLAGDLRTCIDSETAGADVGEKTAEAAAHIETKTGAWPVIYSGDAFFRAKLASHLPIGQCPRWIARYGSHRPVTPAVDIWQFSDDAHVAGTPHPLDADVYMGKDLASFREKFVLKSGLDSPKKA